jgi:hypothetical protein
VGGGTGAVEGPAERFARVLTALREVAVRPEVALDEAPAPHRLAPYAVALTGDVAGDGDTDLATGRFVLLHDPAGHDAWEGTWRVVSFVRADLEPELAADPLLTGVGWTWLTEALESRGARYVAAGGTVTRVASESFGTMAERTPEAEIEVRASWTPLLDEDPAAVGAHLAAWAELLCTTAGLPPVPPGVVPLPNRRGARSR